MLGPIPDWFITPLVALTIDPVWQGVTLLSDDLAKLPVHKYHKQKDNSRERVGDQTNFLLRRKPNPFMTAGVWKQVVTNQALLWGNSYSFIDRDENARPIGLYLLPPDRTSSQLENGVLRYETFIGTDKVYLSAPDVFHLRGLGNDGIRS